MENKGDSAGQPAPLTDWDDIYTGGATDYEAPDADLVEIAAGLEPARALDVGCGAGGLVLALAETGWRVTGIDIAGKAIAAARRVLADHGAEASLSAADATKWKPPEQYDLITSSFAMPEGEERAAVLRMIRSALAPGGVVAIKEFDPSMSRHSHFAGFDFVTIDELTEAFDGLEVERAEVVSTPVHEHAEGSASEDWTAILFIARLPARYV
jgi:2-polyprenyl-3-methyl-5-hydroxy-6-metoxy-1,4-benzoquinol methylase